MPGDARPRGGYRRPARQAHRCPETQPGTHRRECTAPPTRSVPTAIRCRGPRLAASSGCWHTRPMASTRHAHLPPGCSLRAARSRRWRHPSRLHQRRRRDPATGARVTADLDECRPESGRHSGRPDLDFLCANFGDRSGVPPASFTYKVVVQDPSPGPIPAISFVKTPSERDSYSPQPGCMAGRPIRHPGRHCQHWLTGIDP